MYDKTVNLHAIKSITSKYLNRVVIIFLTLDL